MAQRVTPDMLSDWDAHKATIEIALKSPLDGPNGAEERRGLLRDLCWHAVMTERPTVEQAVEALTHAAPTKEFHTVLTDVLWLLTIEAPEADTAPERKRLVDLVRRIHTGGAVPGAVLKERLDPTLMAKAGLISLSHFRTRAVRLHTREFLVQQKFNLLREESEGYSKLVTELTRSELSESNVESVIGTLQSLVGYFDLDPNRVLDLVLEAYEHNQDNASYLRIIARFPRASLAHLTGFKFKYQYAAGSEADPKGSRPAGAAQHSQSLYLLAARLIKHKFITIEDLYPHLQPEDSLAAEEYAKRFEKSSSTTASAITSSSSSAPAPGLLGIAPPGIGLAMRGLDDDIAPLAPVATTTTTTPTTAASSAADAKENQKLGLVAALLAINDWEDAEGLLIRLARIDPASHPPITRALCERLHRMLEPVYALVRFAPPRRAVVSTTGAADALTEDDLVRDWKSLKRVLCPVLLRLGLHISHDLVLFTKLCRVLKEYMKVGSAGSAGDLSKDEAFAVTEHIVVKVLLPGLSLAGCNPGLAQEVWDVLKLFPYQTRYDAYARWRTQCVRVGLLAAAKAEATGEARKILRRISKDNVKMLGRQLGKATHSNPAAVLETVVSQICSYDNLIAPVVDALKYLTSLSYDVLSYTIVEHLSSSRDKVKSDGTSEAHWLQGLATFTGALYRKYPGSLELHGLLEYLTSQLASGSSLELIIFREVMAKMAGIEGGEGSLSDTQVQALAGSELLKQESSPIPMARNLKKPSARLREALLSSNLATSLLILIAQQRGLILYTNKASHLKPLGDLYDKCQETLIQYTEFLQTNVTPATRYAALFPPLRDLVTKCHLDPESIFGILRPVLPQLYPADDGAAEKDKTAAVPSEALVRDVRDVFPEAMWESLSPQLYTTFWSLSLYDIEVPADRYKAEIAKLRESLKTLSDEIVRDPTTATEKKKERDRVQAVVQKLEEDLEKQKANYDAVMRRLEKDKALWFPTNNARSTATTIVAALTRTCILPRALHSMADAIYCARFVQLLHKLDTPNFSTLQYFNSVLTQVVLGIFCCTEGEAVRLGRLLRETIATLESWRSNKDVYLRECSSKRGMAASFSDTSKRVPFDQFPRLLYKWYLQTTKAFTDCLDAGEYMQVKNALLVLTRINDVYPTLRRAHEHLEKRVNRLRDTEEREDIKLLAARYSSLLAQKKNPELERHQQLLSEEEFLGARLAARVLAKDKETTEAAAPTVAVLAAAKGKEKETQQRPPLPSLKEALASPAAARTIERAAEAAPTKRLSATAPPFHPATVKSEPRSESSRQEREPGEIVNGSARESSSISTSGLKPRSTSAAAAAIEAVRVPRPSTQSSTAATSSSSAPAEASKSTTESRRSAVPAAALPTAPLVSVKKEDREREREKELPAALVVPQHDEPLAAAVKRSTSRGSSGGDDGGKPARRSESSDDLSASSSSDKTRKRRSDRDAREASSGSSAKDDKDRKDAKRRRTTPDGGESPKEPSPATRKELPQLTATVKREPAGDREPSSRDSRASSSSSSSSSTSSKGKEREREEPDIKRRRVARSKDDSSSSASSRTVTSSSSSSSPALPPSLSSSSSRDSELPVRTVRGRGEFKARDERRDERKPRRK